MIIPLNEPNLTIDVSVQLAPLRSEVLRSRPTNFRVVHGVAMSNLGVKLGCGSACNVVGFRESPVSVQSQLRVQGPGSYVP